jgi:hypothetical protein
MIQRRDRARFLLKTVQAVAIAGHGRGQRLDRNVPAEARIVGAVDLPHAAGPDGADDLIRTAARTGRQTHSRGSS